MGLYRQTKFEYAIKKVYQRFYWFDYVLINNS